MTDELKQGREHAAQHWANHAHVAEARAEVEALERAIASIDHRLEFLEASVAEAASLRAERDELERQLRRR